MNRYNSIVIMVSIFLLIFVVIYLSNNNFENFTSVPINSTVPMNSNVFLYSKIQEGLITEIVNSLQSISLSDLQYPSSDEFIKELIATGKNIPYGTDPTYSSIRGYYASLSKAMSKYKSSPQVIKHIEKVSEALAYRISLQIDRAISRYDNTIQQTYLNPASSPFVSYYF